MVLYSGKYLNYGIYIVADNTYIYLCFCLTPFCIEHAIKSLKKRNKFALITWYKTEPVIMSTSFLQYLINLLNKNPQIFSFNEHSLIISSVGFKSSLA